MQKKSTLSLSRVVHSAVAAMLGFVSAQSVHGAVISYGGVTTVPSAATFPTTTLGTDGWGLYQAAPNTNPSTTGGGGSDLISTLPTYVSAANVNTSVLNTPYAGSTMYPYSQLTVNGTQDFTGLHYNTNTPSGSLTSAAVFTVTLSTNASAIPHEFQLGLLTGNSGGVANDPGSFILYDNYGTPSVSSASATGVSDTKTNDFILFDITGAAAGDVLSVYETGSSSGRAALAGYTFDTIHSVPEPGSLALSGAAALVFLGRRRRSPRGENIAQ